MTRRFKRKFWTWFWRITILFVILLLFSITGNQETIIVMQTDTLNTLNYMRLEQEQSDIPWCDSDDDMFDYNLVTPPEETTVPLTDAERELFERVVMAECRGGGIEGMLAVAQCIHDRVYLWNMTPMEVLRQDSQFEDPYQGEISAEAVQAVWAAFDENMKAFENHNVTHFYKEGTPEPDWTKGKTYVGTIGGNRFYESNY